MDVKTKRLSDAELEIMLVVWGAEGPVTSGHVLAGLPGRKWALATLMSVLARLIEKGYLQCDRSTRVNLYSATITEAQYKAAEGKTLIEKLYGNSLRSLVTGLYSENAIGEEELRELRRFLNEMAGEVR